MVKNHDPERFVVVENDNLPVTLGKEIDKVFTIFDTKEKRNISLFEVQYEKIMHAIITDSSLTYYDHVHPEQEGSVFHLRTSLPTNGKYFVFLNYTPLGSTEQIGMFNLLTAESPPAPLSSQKPDIHFSKIIGEYEVTLNTGGQLMSEALTHGMQQVSFTIKNSRTKQNISDLEPYLGAYGHLVMIHQQKYEYIHVHPTNTAVLQSGDRGGPLIEFTPMSMTEKVFSKGVYRMFLQFKHQGEVQLASFTVEVK